ncbi:ATPase, AAA family protein [Trichomonas vaginalis G3]|uniref:ATPase, AAA family protein n=1 Tax=Trichomonas vaginalis (strain ATCC PRA-98 / G3) TaxID=412133 RepID=A2FMT2_TRIV3|nr:AAA domain-containing family [Trichomonas vaginalis G3]EAX93796.1 ATPase, AAA family protein [Trichomonas vaginalis G3]KAI5527843.1 AAA domain-containing family [Trichomonas vaginalis G3]|eukprot:XP_001306726.1 ATPase, AAA family protein [Trichomonas vaginalis G3]
MKSLVDVFKAGDNHDEALIACLTGIAACTDKERVLPVIFEELILEHGEKLRNIRTIEKTEDIDFTPFPVPEPEQVIIQTQQVSVSQPTTTQPNSEPTPVPNRMTVQSERFKAKGLDTVRTPGFQTALAATGKTKENKEEEIDERLRGVDPRLLEIIENEILIGNPGTKWEDIAGLDHAKQAVQEAIILPMKYPDLFTELREPPRGVLFFGPPGTGKTLIAKALATEAQCTFFNISASSLTSKWVGEGEKLTRALFALARIKAPSIVFIDEIDSILTKRGDNDFEASRRVKTEFLLQFEGVGSGKERVLILGATNRPQDIDDAARRRFTKRIYIPLPDIATRGQLVRILVKRASNTLNEEQIDKIAEMTDGYSCADMTTLLKEAAMVPLRETTFTSGVKPTIRPLSFEDVEKTLKSVKPSVSADSLVQYVEWNNEFGSTAM